MSTEVLQRVFKTLADTTRMRVLALLEREELAVQELMEVLGMAQSRVSSHLKVLRDAGLLRDRKQGTFTFYRFVPPASGPWQAWWNLVRQNLENDPQVARDREVSREVVLQRAARARAYFDSVAPEWDTLREIFNDDALRARALNRLVTPDLRVLELGTGTGVLAVELARRGIHVIAVDHAPRMIDAARAKIQESGLPGIELRRGDASQLPLEDSEVDASFAHMVFRYLPRPREALHELARVTRPGGLVVLIDFTQHELEWVNRELGVQWMGFAPEEIETWFAESGLEQTELEIYPPPNQSRELPATFIASARRPRAGATR
jgi:ArsR family transcriptional regulator